MVLVSKPWLLALTCALFLLSACGANQSNTAAPPSNPELENVLPPEVALNVQNWISESLLVPVENIKIKTVEKKDWPDGCLGLPQGDEACTQAVTPGWLLTFVVNDLEYRYRVDETGTVIRQEP